MRSSSLPVIVLALACGKPSAPTAASTPSTTSTQPSPSKPETTEEPPTAADPKAKPRALVVTKEMRAEYHRYLEAGRKLSKAGEWTEAIEEFDAALEVIPGDDRALGELSWAAFSSGDHVKAAEMAHAAVLSATSPKVKAAALYNLGRAEEALARITEARTAYAESIALRPNKTVQQRLDALGKSGPSEPEGLPCDMPMAEAQLCACLLKTVVEPDAPQECAIQPTGLGDFKLARYATNAVGEENVMVVARGATGWFVAAQIGYVYNPGMMGISEDFELTSAKERTIGTHTIVEIVAHKSRTDSDMGIDEIETEDSDSVVLCVKGDGATRTRCPLDLVTDHVYTRERMDMADDIDVSMQTPGLPIRDEMHIEIEIGDDGVAKLRASSGKVDPDRLGDRKLW